MKTYDARGNGNGEVTCTITGGHQSTISDYTAIAVGGDDMDIVRRLTPNECDMLQGYPKGYTDIGDWVDTKGKLHTADHNDGHRYKALGNSIGLPSWYWLVNRMKPFLREGATLGSLFDGIGGFPLVWEATYGKGTARWASEIEEFPIAVTKVHFPEVDMNPPEGDEV